jgi:hypothetical protein
MSALLRIFLRIGLATALVACGSAPSSNAPSKTKPGTDTGASFGSLGDAKPSQPAAADATANGEVWSQSLETLFKVDPATKKVTVVGTFSGCGAVLDIALDANSNMFATSDGGLFRVDLATAACTKIADGTYPNSLSFVPKGTVDPNAEALVGYQDNNDYIRIDTTTGAIATVGSLGNVAYHSSGDIVSVIGGPTYLSVQGDSCDDCLVEVNPATGAVVKEWGSLGRPDVYGLAFWAGSVYGFDDGGDLFEVTFSGDRLTATDVPIPDKAQDLQFAGAGSTTSAPVTAPR